MSELSRKFVLFPWIGGINTALDPASLPPHQLVEGNNVVFKGTNGVRSKRDPMDFGWDDGSNGSDSIVGLGEFSYGSSSRTRKFVGLTDASTPVYYSYDPADGTRTTLTDAGTVYPDSVTTARMVTFNNKLIITTNGTDNTTKLWDGTNNVINLGTSEVFTVTCGVDTGGDQYGLYFDCDSVNTSYRVWFDVDAGGNAPAAGGRTLVSVSISSGDNENTIATAIKTALDAVSSGAVFSVSVSSDVATVTLVSPGVVTDVDGSGLGSPTDPHVVAVSTQGADAPKGYAMVNHLNRLWMSDKSDLDRIHYSPVGDPNTWNGSGDSGGLDIRTGDGDPEGITCMFSFRDVLFVAKKTRLYKVIGSTPETFRVVDVSDGIGIVGPNAFASFDQDDVFFVSEKGIHALSVTEQYGDFKSQFVSIDIQPTFEGFSHSLLKNTKAAYVPSLNSVAFTFNDPDVGAGVQNTVWLYNVSLKSWYHWDDVSCESMIIANDSDKKRLYFGSTVTRITKSEVTGSSDKATDDSNQAISYQIKTGFIHPVEDPMVEVAFRRVGIFYAPRLNSTITISAQIDNKPVQAIALAESTGADLLGSTFILGSSLLSSSAEVAPYSRTIDGVGRGIQLTISQSGTEEQIDMQGLFIEYEPVGLAPEILGTA